MIGASLAPLTGSGLEVVAESDGRRAVLVPDSDAAEFNPRRDFDSHVGVMWARHPRYLLGDVRYDDSEAAHAKYHPEWAEVDAWSQEHPWIDTAAMVRHLARRHEASLVLPLYLYDHSGLSLAAGQDLVGAATAAADAGNRAGRFVPDPQGWDTSHVGFVFDTARTRTRAGIDLGDVAGVLEAEVAEYDAYLRGDVWTVRIEHQADHDWHISVRTGEMRCAACGRLAEQNAPDCLVREEIDAVGGYLGHEQATAAARDLLADYAREAIDA